MPRAIRAFHAAPVFQFADVPAFTGVLIECDPSIKSIIVNIDAANHDYIIEDLDDQHVVVKENMVAALKRQLDDVGSTINEQSPHFTMHIAAY
ncbi:RNA polymerase II transcription factor B subunit 5 [Colletotrichum gloeosporioides]|uniref:General transcription and DNA repair factor IIH subunit TFB5 n=1 Tax=Colletotrichum gloeosporioides TaxID=474922 RepID=A0A8H4CSN3_COLGL|nr:RNA polymerase II transcription factor B subunit 5 [Colletotrichum gloeosporioides]KAF3809101.1 RNA polymerase II transcription factor B subunit 5 [Colletotrichum gloeosporioides]